MKFYKSMFLSPYFWMSIFIWGMCIYVHRSIENGTIPPDKQAAAYGFLIPFLILIGLFFMIRTTYYIIVEERKLVVKNAFCPFLKSSYMYEDIKHIEYSANSRTSGLSIVKKSGMSAFYPLECMWKKDYPRLIEMLETKGVKFKDHEALIGKDKYNKIISEKNIEDIYKNNQVMEFYKSKFLTFEFWVTIFMECMSIYGYYGLIDGSIHPNKQTFAFFIFSFFALCGLILMIQSTYYIMIEKEKLIIKNAVFSLFGSSFRYEDIEYIKILDLQHTGFKIYQKDSKPKFYPLDICVRRKDYPQIIEILQAKGVKFKMENYLWEEYQKYLQKR